jgi:hypothetical protein
MKSTDYLILIILCFVVAVTACQKDKESGSKKEILSANSWKLASYKLNDEEMVLEDCQKDNYLTFNRNGTYTDNTGPILCDNYETNINGTWTLSGDEKTLTLESFQGVQTASVEIIESKLVLTIIDDTDIIVMTCIPY